MLVDVGRGSNTIPWMDEILHHFETMGNYCLLVFTGESPFQGFLGGAGFCPSTVCFPTTTADSSWYSESVSTSGTSGTGRSESWPTKNTATARGLGRVSGDGNRNSVLDSDAHGETTQHLRLSACKTDRGSPKKHSLVRLSADASGQRD